MAATPKGQPRSVPDPDKAAYDRMVEEQRRTNVEKDGAGVGHPGFAESLIPFWGSGKEAVADFQDGDYVGAGLNGALAVSDVFLAGALLKGGAKMAVRAAARAGKRPYVMKWKTTSGRLHRQGYIPKGHEGHHWLIPQNGWGKNVPDAVKNAHWNIKPLPAEVHGRIHHRVKAPDGSYMPRYGPAAQFWRGTPIAAKPAAAGAVGHPVTAAKAKVEEKK